MSQLLDEREWSQARLGQVVIVSLYKAHRAACVATLRGEAHPVHYVGDCHLVALAVAQVPVTKDVGEQQDVRRAEQ